MTIDLTDTCLENLQYELEVNNGELDWLFIKVEEQVLSASGDPSKLTTILTIFLDEIIPTYADPNYEYQIYVELIGAPAKIWGAAKAKMISEDTLQITHLPDMQNVDLKFLDEPNWEMDDISKCKPRLSEGSIVQVKLQDTWLGVALIAKE